MSKRIAGNGSGKFEIHQTDMGGWVRVYADKMAAVPDDLAHFLSHALTEWFRQRPHLRICTVVPVVRNGNTVELHAWFDLHVFPDPRTFRLFEQVCNPKSLRAINERTLSAFVAGPYETFERLLEAAADDPPMRAYLLAGWLAGLRRNEALELEWKPSDKFPWLDFDRKRIWCQNDADTTDEQERTFGS